MKVFWLSPGDPGQRTGGYLWNARIAGGLRARGWEVAVLALSGTWPLPGIRDPAPIDAVPDGARVVADGLLWPGLGEHGARLAARCRVAVVVHSLLSRETNAASPERLDTAERDALRGVALRVATSAMTAEELGADLPSVVVIPGTDRAARARGGDGRTLLTVGTLVPRKGHDVLIDALATGMPDDWRLLCAGADRDPAWAARLREQAGAAGVADRVAWLGDLDDAGLEAAWSRADVVVQAARYEAFGMAIAEAVARGLPVITTPAGVVRHLAPGAVRVVDDAAGLVSAVRELLGDPEVRRRQAERAWAAAAALPGWQDQAGRFAQHLRELG